MSRWLHLFSIGGANYSQFADEPAQLAKVGDLVQFHWVAHKKGGKTYRNIVGTVEIVRPFEETERADGFVYVLTNPSMPRRVKIGMTERTPENRCAELSGLTAIPTPFTVCWSLAVAGNALAVERRVHNNLARFNCGKEFYKVSPDQAREAVLAAYYDLYPEQKNVPNSMDARRAAYDHARAEAPTRRDRDGSSTTQSPQPNEAELAARRRAELAHMAAVNVERDLAAKAAADMVREFQTKHRDDIARRGSKRKPGEAPHLGHEALVWGACFCLILLVGLTLLWLFVGSDSL